MISAASGISSPVGVIAGGGAMPFAVADSLAAVAGRLSGPCPDRGVVPSLLPPRGVSHAKRPRHPASREIQHCPDKSRKQIATRSALRLFQLASRSGHQFVKWNSSTGNL